MVWDWLAREGWIVLNWWALVTVAGLTVMPLLARLMTGLPDRGYTLARPAGVLLVAFVFWLLASLGFLRNTSGGIIVAWLVVLGVSLLVYFRVNTPFDLGAWWRENRPVVIAAEVLFVVLLVGWAIVRAHQNDLNGTEKPMDLAFMSAIQRSETFPPNDPWLSGYSISYYYFGYVMAAMLSKLSGVWTTTGYNMHIAMLFALTGLAAFGVTVNLVRSRALHRVDSPDAVPLAHKNNRPSHRTAILVGLLAMVFVVLLGNFHAALVELPYSSRTASEAYLNFWDTKSRNTYGEAGPGPASNLLDTTFLANRWWWFDAARAVRDIGLDGGHIEVIAEFPQFSFLLADSHPHVMALPYTLLAMGLALNVLLSSVRPNMSQMIFYGVCAGGLIFLNTWDAPVYFGLLVGAEGLRRLRRMRGRLGINDWSAIIGFGVALGLTCVLAYLPFLISFQSQLGGILPNVLHPTRPQQIFIVFGPFILLLALILSVEAWRGRRLNWSLGYRLGGGALALLLAVMLALLVGGRLNPITWGTTQFLVNANGGWNTVLGEIAIRRLVGLITLLPLLLGLIVVTARLFPTQSDDNGLDYPPATGFVLLLVGGGLLLVIAPEFVYLRDNFGTRMNTIFKFYYQAWVLFSIASAYGVYTLLADADLPRPSLALRTAFGGVLGVVLVAGMLYPVLGIYNRTLVETGIARAVDPAPLTLDGGRSVAGPDDYAALMCLRALVQGDDSVVAETTWDGSYDFGGAGRTGALTGIPSVLGWRGHQSQWRGPGFFSAVGSRHDDIPRLYSDLRFDVVWPIIERYGIDYIVVGDVERRRYGAEGEDKFIENLHVVCESGTTRIYQVGSRITASGRGF